MKICCYFRNFAVALASVALIGLALPASAAAEEHKHEQAAAGAHKLKLNAGKKWQTDEPLRKGMSEIRNAVESQHGAIHSGKMKPQNYADLGGKIDVQVAYMVQNCKLEPAADENLHMILEDVIAGSDAMQGKVKKLSRRAGLNKVIAGLTSYGKYFDHPGWKEIE